VTTKWPIVELSKVISFQNGNAFKSKDYVEEGHYLIRIGNVQDGKILKNDDTYVNLAHTEHRFELNLGDFLMSLTGNVGRIAQVTEDILPAALNQRVARLIPNRDLLSPEFTGYLLLSPLIQENIQKISRGTAQQNLSTKDLEKLQIPLPPLDEQKRIVAKLDEALSNLDQVTENSKKALDQIDALWLASIDDVMNEISSVSRMSTIGDIFKTSSGGTPLKSRKDYYEGGSVPWLLSGEVGNSEITSAKNFITELALKETSAKLAPSDSVLVAMYGATAGEVGILRFEASTNQAVCAIHPIDGWNTDFIYFWMLHSKKHLVSLAAGNAQPNISQIKIRSLPIPLLDQRSQENVVSRLSEIKKSQEETYSLKKKSISEQVSLRGSILSAAFSGDF
jgi:type I restriction enzyme S subunit